MEGHDDNHDAAKKEMEEFLGKAIERRKTLLHKGINPRTGDQNSESDKQYTEGWLCHVISDLLFLHVYVTSI